MTAHRRIVFVNRFFYPDHSATSQLLADLAFELARSGTQIEVLASRQLYGDANAGLARSEVIQGVTVRRIWSTAFGRARLWGRALDYCSFYISVAGAVWLRCGSDAIVVTKTDPPLVSLVVTPIAKLRGARVINWLQDLFPEVAGVLGLPFVKGPALQLLRRARNRSLRSAEANVVLGRRMQQHLATEGVPPERIRIIHNWADGTALRPVPPADNPLRIEWGLDDLFVVGYSGNLGRAHEFESILQAAEALRARTDITFLFIGGGSQYVLLANEVRRRALKNVQFRPYQPRERLSESLSASDVHLVSLNPELEGLIVPSKFYGVAAVGRPTLFIGDVAGEIATIVRENECGLAVTNEDGRGLAEAIAWLASNRDMAERMGANARRTFLAGFERSAALRSWKEVLGLPY